jgi:glycosyltransferase involved in cell wall biosynthesis
MDDGLGSTQDPLRPRVSVIVPTRNRFELLRRTLRAILRQANVRLEVLVIDDGSEQDPRGSVAELDEPRIRFFRHAEASGVSKARNHGIREAGGDWVAFCDDDDLWAPEKLAHQVQTASSTGCGWVYSGAVYIDAQQRVRGGSPPLPPQEIMALLNRWNPLPGGCSNVMVERELLNRVGLFDDALGTLADWDLWLRLARRDSPACVLRPHVGYRVHQSNMSLDTARTLAELARLEERHPLDVDRGRLNRFLASQCLKTGQHREALRLLALAVLQDRGRGRLPAAWQDVAMLRRHAAEGARRRLNLDSSRLRQRRHRRQHRADPNVQWKTDAQAWLDQVSKGGEAGTMAGT